MANLFNLGNVQSTAFITKYHPLLDRKYIKEAATSILESTKYNFTGYKTIKIPQIDTQGLGNYANGYKDGQVKTGYETYTLANDRGIKFTFDKIDSEDALGPDFNLINSAFNDFMEQNAIPEFDAKRIAKLAELAGKVVTTDAGPTNIIDELDKAAEYYDMIGYPKEKLVLFMNPKMVTALKQDDTVQRRINVNVASGGLAIKRTVTIFDGMSMIVVPHDRMFDKITLKEAPVLDNFDKTWNKAADAKEVNFLLLPREAAHAITRHQQMKYVDSDVNQEADNHIVFYRVIYDTIVPVRQRRLIYVNKRATVRV